MRIESLILNILVKNEEYTKKVIPHLKPEYFTKRSEKDFFQLVLNFWETYHRLPPRDVIAIELDNLKGSGESVHSESKVVLQEAFDDEYKYDLEWLIQETEGFCKDKSIYNAILNAMKIINGEDENQSENQIPALMQEALSVSFDKDVGHDYFGNAEDRYEFYHAKETKLQTSIELLDLVTDNGLPRRTLNLLIGPSGSGKSAVKCSLAAQYLMQGYNVLYVTLELAEKRTAERIDANLFDIPLKELKGLPKSVFMTKIDKLKEKNLGKLIIKEYPTGTASAANFRQLLSELKTKKGFVPDVMFVDYLGICASSRYKASATVNTYTYQTSVAEELRALAVEFDIVMWSSVQTNRSGMNVSDYDIEAIADSTGPYKTCDSLFAIIRTEELDELNQMILKQLKNRFGDLSFYKKFLVGMDFSRMKIYNIEQTAQMRDQSEDVKKPGPVTHKIAKANDGEILWD